MESEAITMTYTVASKVETLRLDNSRVFMFHGALQLGDNDPLQLAMPVEAHIWQGVGVGDVLTFTAPVDAA